jgi:hypothetical protein
MESSEEPIVTWMTEMGIIPESLSALSSELARSVRTEKGRYPEQSDPDAQMRSHTIANPVRRERAYSQNQQKGKNIGP